MLGAVGIGAAAHFALLYVPFLQRIFGTAPLNARDLVLSLAAASLIIVAAEAWKWWLRRATLSA
jgi:hypothetical protein